MKSSRALSVVVLLVAAFGLTACGGGGGSSDLGLQTDPPVTVTSAPTTTTSVPTSVPEESPAYVSLSAWANGSRLGVFPQPNTTRPPRVFQNEGAALPSGANAEVAQVFLVVSQRPDGWIQVLLPIRPHGSTGWVRVADVTIRQSAYRMRIGLAAGRLTVFGRGKQIYQGPITVGDAAQLKPTGHYYIRALFTAPASRMTDSSYAYGLIEKLSGLLPLGTPVDIAL